MTYSAPVADQLFALETVADLPGLAKLSRFSSCSMELTEAILLEAAKITGDVFAPLNRLGDQEGATLVGNQVSLPRGFRNAYSQYVEGGWPTLGGDPCYGGQGLPFVVATAVQEQLTSANMAFSLCMMLSMGAVEALSKHASEAQKANYLVKLISGEWTGTMNLTEPQAGSDVGALRTKATRHADGSYRIEGQKIFITWGDHDLAENVVHLVLARLPDAPAGTKGISLFIVPKFLDDGTANDLRCVSLEHKLGIHASPTCTMAFGDSGACVGFLLGEEHAGMAAMFTMMNHARISVGLQGVAIAERAFQGAHAFACERVQGKRIIDYPDVRRMLMTIKALTEGTRALTYFNAAAVDRGHAAHDKQSSAAAQGLADLLTPITKAFATDTGVELTSLAIQIYGGMGFIEETGAAQHLRDARIAPIYEGTNGIQAIDLVGRKLPQGHWRALFDEIRAFCGTTVSDPVLAKIGESLAVRLSELELAAEWLLEALSKDMENALAGATPFLKMFGLVLCAYLLGKQAGTASERLSAGSGNADFLNAKIQTASFFATQILPQASGLLPAVVAGRDPLYSIHARDYIAH